MRAATERGAELLRTMRNGIGTYILIILLVLLMFGLVSLGDIFSLALYIILGIVLLALAGAIFFRLRVNRLRRQMEETGETYRSYSWNSTRSPREEKRDGEVTVQQTSSREKVVNREVGDYVEYEDVDESDR